jgi:hypothetical protein
MVAAKAFRMGHRVEARPIAAAEELQFYMNFRRDTFMLLSLEIAGNWLASLTMKALDTTPRLTSSAECFLRSVRVLLPIRNYLCVEHHNELNAPGTVAPKVTCGKNVQPELFVIWLPSI